MASLASSNTCLPATLAGLMKSWKIKTDLTAIFDGIGLVEPSDLYDLEDDDVDMICGHLLKLEANRFRKGFKAILPVATNVVQVQDRTLPMLDVASLMARVKTANEANDCKGVVDAMREGSSTEVVVKEGLDMLRQLMRDESVGKEKAELHRTMLRFLDGIPLVMEVMQMHGASSGVAETGCAVLSAFAVNNDNRKIIGESDGIATILNMIVTHGTSSAGIAENGCHALWNLALNNNNNKKTIQEAGGIEMILRMLVTHGTSSAGVAENGCGALCVLSTNSVCSSSIAGTGGIAVILSAMEKHAALDAGVALQGRCALVQIAYKNADNRKNVREMGGIAMIFRLMHGISDAGVAQRYCDALCALAHYQTDSSKITMILEMMEKVGTSSTEVARVGCVALKNYTLYQRGRLNIDNQKIIGEKGGIEMILSMMRTHGVSNAKIAGVGCCALWFIACGHTHNKKRIGEAGGIVMILRLMEEHGASHAEIARCGCGVLSELADNTDNKRKILAATGVSIVERMKLTWASDKKVQKQADSALGKLR